MRIAYFIDALHAAGNVERLLTVKANYLADVAGYEVYVITLRQNDRPVFFKLSENVQLVDLQLKESSNNNRSPIDRIYRNVMQRRAEDKEFKRRMNLALIRIKPDITVSLLGRESMFVHQAKDGSVKLVESHLASGSQLQQPSRNWLKRATNYVNYLRSEWHFSRYNQAVVLTNEDAERHMFKRNIKVIPNPMTLRVNSVAPLHEKRVLAVGSICYQTGYDRLIEAWAMVSRKYPKWHLLIVGNQSDDVAAEQLESVITAHNLTNVELLPASHNVLSEYLNSSMLVISSRYEGLPVVMLEAMACGLPCVSFDCPCGPKDVIANGEDGVLVENGNISALADAMMRLMGDEVERKGLGANAYMKAKKYALRSVMRQWTQLFESLATQRKVLQKQVV